MTAHPRPLPVPAASTAPPVRDVPDGSLPVPPPAHQVLDTVGRQPVGRPVRVAAPRARRPAGAARRPAPLGRPPRHNALPRIPRRPALPPLPRVHGLPRPADLCALGSRYARPAYGDRAAGAAVARLCARATAMP